HMVRSKLESAKLAKVFAHRPEVGFDFVRPLAAQFQVTLERVYQFVDRSPLLLRTHKGFGADAVRSHFHQFLAQELLSLLLVGFLCRLTVALAAQVVGTPLHGTPRLLVKEAVALHCRPFFPRNSRIACATSSAAVVRSSIALC